MKQILLSFLLFFNYGLSFAEETPTEPPPVALIESAEELGLGSPRETFTTFLHSMNDIKRGQAERINDATRALDLSAINPLIREEKGRDLAWMLLEAIDKTKIVNL
ncbi:MAG TPA: mechanosensitive ion channel family protein, partial [Cycloclasticus sp.]|nr:mechanosensitive ion channel family protein [Cycloclasticus sp.]